MKPTSPRRNRGQRPSHGPAPVRHDWRGDRSQRAAPDGRVQLFGVHAVEAALRNAGRPVLRLLMTENAENRLAEAVAARQAAPERVSPRDLDRLLGEDTVHQGVLLETEPLEEPDVAALAARADAGPIVVLDQVTDPHNVGAILRSAAAFGAVAVVLPDRNAPEISGTLAKSASGAVEHVPLVRVVNLNRTLELLKKAGFWSVGLAGEAEQTLASHKLGGRVALVLGSEGDGLRRLTREACDLMARLPTRGPVASLNVSNAAAIALYELVRAD